MIARSMAGARGRRRRPRGWPRAGSTSMPGISRFSVATRRGAKYLAVETTPRVTRPAWPAFSAPTWAMQLASAISMRRAASSATSASGVGAEPAPVSARRSIGAASAVSRLRICACTAGGVSPSRSAAAVIEPVSATAARARSWRRVMASSRGNSKNLNAASRKVNSHEPGGDAMMLRNERPREKERAGHGVHAAGPCRPAAVSGSRRADRRDRGRPRARPSPAASGSMQRSERMPTATGRRRST